MSLERNHQPDPARTSIPWGAIASVFATLLVLLLIFFGAIFSLTPSGQAASQWLSWFLALNSIQLWWYVTRASGIVAYLLLWFSMVLGLAVSSKYLDRLLDRLFTYDFHQFISLLSIAFVLLHVAVLLFDRYLPYTLWQILVPFISPYRPLWVGAGVIGFYLTLLVTITFYVRNLIGNRAFRLIHALSLLGYLGATLHGIYAGTDSPLASMQLLYKGTGFVVIFLSIFWLVLVTLRKLEAHRQALSPTKATRPPHAVER
jgi:predicted ferric reductase